MRSKAVLLPPLLSTLTSFRTKEKLRSGEMAVSGDQWPIFLYQGYNYDPEDPWNGLFRSTLLVYVISKLSCPRFLMLTCISGVQTHIYLAQFCGKGTQGHSIRKCSHP